MGQALGSVSLSAKSFTGERIFGGNRWCQDPCRHISMGDANERCWESPCGFTHKQQRLDGGIDRKQAR